MTSPGVPDYLDMQRAALRAVLELSADTVDPVEQDIEGRCHDARERILRERAACAEEVNRAFAARLDNIQTDYDTHLRTGEQRYTSELQSLEQSIAAAQSDVIGEGDSALVDAKKKLDDTLWEAEAVIRSTIGGLRKELKALEDKLKAARAQPAALLEQHEELLVQLGQLAPQAPDAPAPPALTGDLNELYTRNVTVAQKDIQHLEACKFSRILVRPRLFIVAPAIVIGAGLVAYVLHLAAVPYANLLLTLPVALAGAGGLVALMIGPLRTRSLLRVRELDHDIRSALTEAIAALDLQWEQTRTHFKKEEVKALKARDRDVKTAQLQFRAVQSRIEDHKNSGAQRIASSASQRRQEIETQHRLSRQAAENIHKDIAALAAEKAARLVEVEQRFADRLADCQATYDQDIARLHADWKPRIEALNTLLEANQLYDESGVGPPGYGPLVPFGSFAVDLGTLSGSVRELGGIAARGLDPPAVLSLPRHGCLLVQADAQGRQAAIGLLQILMIRLLTTLPPGRVRFTLLDAVGLGKSFAGFMHLADYEDALVGGRIWTETAHIEARLRDLTDHMETVIQKYLRNEYDTIDAYNRQAGRLAEPYRFLVIADFPANFSDDALRRLQRILESGPRCGVFALIACDPTHKLPPGHTYDRLARQCAHLSWRQKHFVWQDDVFRRFGLTVVQPPSEEELTRMMHEIGRRASASMRIEVPFERIAPAADADWNSQCASEIEVPIGLTAGTRVLKFALGRGVAQHVLIAGKTGSGKSTLLHVLITNLAMWYSPDEVEFYLVDFKKGVEFKTYATHQLPHARVIAIESDREFGLSVLQRIDDELQSRGDSFRAHEVQDLAAFRRVTGEPLPRVLLIVDEFQVLFAEDDRLAQDAAVLLDRLVRQGRAFGIHVILGTQTLGGTSRLPRSTMGQMAVRIALHCTESDSLLILDESNPAARDVTRPGEGIYNDAGGMSEGNQHFQTAWVSDVERDRYLQRIAHLAAARNVQRNPIVFEGNVPGVLAHNGALAKRLSNRQTTSTSPCAWLGEAVAIKEPTTVTFRRQSGANLMIVGQQDETAVALIGAVLIALSTQFDATHARFVVLDGTPADSPLAGQLQCVADAMPQHVDLVAPADIDNAVGTVAAELKRRQDTAATDAPAIFVVINGLQRYRGLRRREDEFSFSLSGAAQTVHADQHVADILRDGPTLGIHVIVWSDTYAALERALSRSSLGEFDNRVLFQMSASDSSNLIDAPTGNRLGFHRALFYSEEQGAIEKFRPYAIPDPAWLQGLKIET